jgi:hypothetical protein
MEKSKFTGLEKSPSNSKRWVNRLSVPLGESHGKIPALGPSNYFRWIFRTWLPGRESLVLPARNLHWFRPHWSHEILHWSLMVPREKLLEHRGFLRIASPSKPGHVEPFVSASLCECLDSKLLKNGEHLMGKFRKAVRKWRKPSCIHIWLVDSCFIMIWLVVYLPTPLKNDGVKVSWDDDIPNWMEKVIQMCQTTSQGKYGGLP